MSNQYRLVFAGEVAEGQHPAVVRKRLAKLLKLSDERMDVLFSGKSVVVKKAIDAENAARYQAVFDKAGAVLQIISTGGENPATPASPAPPAKEAPEQDENSGLDVLPVGADILNPDERRKVDDADIDTSHLSVQGAVFVVDEPAVAVSGPSVDHLSLAEVGARIGDEEDLVVAEIDVDFTVAEVGAMMADESDDLAAAPVDPASIDFDVAEPGAEMDTRDKPPPPPAPDTSHIKLDNE